MRFTIATLAALATVAFSQGLDSLPACARTCVTGFTSGSKIGDCASLDIKCICSSKTFLSDIACCLAGSCSEADQEKATSFALSFCKISGVTDLPTAVSCASTASSTATGSGTASTTETTQTTQTTETTQTTQTTASTETNASAQTTGSTTGTPAATEPVAAASTTSTPNAAPTHFAGYGGIVGGAAAIAAVLL